MKTIITFWNVSHSELVNETLEVEETEQCDNTTFLLSQLPSEAVEMRLQSSLPGYTTSRHSQYLRIPGAYQEERRGEDSWQFWLILCLSILLILYIIGTVLCLRRVRNRRGYDFVAPNADNQAGNFSLCSELNGQPPPASVPSDTGSRDTVQESIIVSQDLCISGLVWSFVTLQTVKVSFNHSEKQTIVIVDLN